MLGVWFLTTEQSDIRFYLRQGCF